MKRLFTLFIALFVFAISANARVIKVLSIGNSFSQDVVEQHLFDEKIGRYVGACTMCEVLLGKSVLGNKYKPKWMSNEEALFAQKAAHAAVAKPNEVTEIR